MKKTLKIVLLLMLVCIGFATNAHAQRNGGRLSLGVGLLYENGMDVTLAYEHEMNYRHAWEFFANGYLKWTECKSCGHICPESFWRNYRTYGFGVAYKPCVVRGRNHYGNLRIGAIPRRARGGRRCVAHGHWWQTLCRQASVTKLFSTSFSSSFLLQ